MSPSVPGALTLFAHQGGWDEILFVLVPIALFAGLLGLANQRASRTQLEAQADAGDEAGPSDPDA